MIGLVVTGHGLFAEGMHSSVRMIAGENEHIKYICFQENTHPKELAEHFHRSYEALSGCDGIVVLSDLPGGTPFNTAVECSLNHPDKQIVVLSGTNLPMIITGVGMLHLESDPQAMADKLILEGKDSLLRFQLTERREETEEDGI